jgi:hypothetical protein
MLKLLHIVLFALILEGNLGLQVASMVAQGFHPSDNRGLKDLQPIAYYLF